MQYGTCELCDVIFTSDQHRNDHMTGSKHRKKLARTGQSTGQNVSNASVQSPPPPYSQNTGQNQTPQQAALLMTVPQMNYYAQPPGVPMAMSGFQGLPYQPTGYPQQICASPMYQAPQHQGVPIYQFTQPVVQNTINVCVKGEPDGGNVIQSGPASNIQQSNGTNGEKNEDKQSSNNSSSTKETCREGEFYCHTCSISCNSEETMNVHVKGSKHLKNLREAEATQKSAYPYFCLVCEVPCNSESSLESHCKGAGHLKNMRDKADRVVEQSDLCCLVCKVRCSGRGALEEHLGGRLHSSNVDRIRPPPVPVNTSSPAPDVSQSAYPYFCLVCEVPCNSESSLESHWNGVGHLKNMRDKADRVVGLSDLCCLVCKVRCSGRGALEEHLGGRLHSSNVDRIRPPPVPVNTSSPAPGTPMSENSRVCMVCNKRFNSEIPLKAHFEGGKHQRNKERAVDPQVESDNLYCRLCKVLFDSLKVLNEHLGGPAHRYSEEEWERNNQFHAGHGCSQQPQERRTVAGDIDGLTIAICDVVEECPNGLKLFKDKLVETRAMLYRPRDNANDDTIDKVVRKLKMSERLIPGNIGDFLEMCKGACETVNQDVTMWGRLKMLCEEFMGI